MTETSQSSGATDSLATRPSLVEKLRDWREVDAWYEFHRTYLRLVEGIARKRGLSPHDAEEVAQKVFQRVAQTIQEFEPRKHRGSFRKWLGNLARWKSGEVARSNQRHQARGERLVAAGELPSTENRPAASAGMDDPEAELEAATRREIIQAALARLSSQVGERQLQVYQLHIMEGWPVAKVASFCRVSTANVYVIKHRVGQRLRVELAALHQELGPQAVSSHTPGPARLST